MIEFVCEFVVKEPFRGQFELAFGPGGAWSKLYSRSPGFRGTTVLRDEKNPQRYLTIDLWETEAQREQLLVEHEGDLTEMRVTFVEWTESIVELGTFRVLAEATVRPRGSTRRRRY